LPRILLIDGDVVAYKTAAAVEKAIEWEPGFWTWHCEEQEVRDAVLSEIDRYMDELDGDEYRIALTDSERNFRFDVMPTYKGNRKNVKKPLVLKAIRQWMLDDLDALVRPRLEGDDILGILATWPKLRGEKIVVSIDKDMKTIPGLYCRDLETGVVEITEEEADYWHIFQTLTGDQTDGYSGCPGVGPKKAEKMLEESGCAPPWGVVQECWRNVVVPAYEAKGLSEEVALMNARVARILRASDYDFKKKEPILWKP